MADANATSIYELDDIGKTGCTIYAVANVGDDMFKDLNGSGYPTNATTLDNIRNLSYNVGDDVSLDLPVTGIPMVGSLSGANMSTGAVYTVELKALMARVDLNLSLEADHTNASFGYPAMSVTDVTINNIPKSVPFTAPTSESSIDNGLISATKEINSNTIYNSDAKLSYTFYVFENMQGTKNPTIPAGANNSNLVIKTPPFDKHYP